MAICVDKNMETTTTLSSTCGKSTSTSSNTSTDGNKPWAFFFCQGWKYHNDCTGVGPRTSGNMHVGQPEHAFKRVCCEFLREYDEAWEIEMNIYSKVGSYTSCTNKVHSTSDVHTHPSTYSACGFDCVCR